MKTYVEFLRQMMTLRKENFSFLQIFRMYLRVSASVIRINIAARSFSKKVDLVAFDSQIERWMKMEVIRTVFKERGLDLKAERAKTLSFIKNFSVVLPSRFREEFSGDITEIYYTLKNEGHSKITIYFFLTLNVVNICWVSFRFKWSEYFGTARKAEKGE